MRVLTGQLDRRNLCDPAVTENMFSDLVYKVKLIQTLGKLKKTRILMVKNSANEIIASVNYRGDINQSFPGDHNSRYLSNFRKVFGAEIISVEPEEFYETYLLTGRPSMLGDIIFDVYNNVEIILHCGIPINPLGSMPMSPWETSGKS